MAPRFITPDRFEIYGPRFGQHLDILLPLSVFHISSLWGCLSIVCLSVGAVIQFPPVRIKVVLLVQFSSAFAFLNCKYGRGTWPFRSVWGRGILAGFFFNIYFVLYNGGLRVVIKCVLSPVRECKRTVYDWYGTETYLRNLCLTINACQCLYKI